MNNRNYKDSVFVDLFAKDIYAKENFISLYNALHDTNLDPDSTSVDPVMIEQVLYMKYYNDIAMLVDNKIVVLIEHQSTINENMPFRLLEYIARIYEKLTTPRDKFGKKLVKLPVPEFYVFYNGTEGFPSEKTLKLSDAFIKPEDKYGVTDYFPLEITVKVININIDKHNPILLRCNVLQQYSTFVEMVRQNIADDIDDPFTGAINMAIDLGVLSNYLERKSTEIRNMLLTEYDYDTDIAVQRKEAFDDGIQQGISQGLQQGIAQGELQKAIETAKNMLNKNISIDVVGECTGLPLETIEQLKKELECML